MIFNKQDHVRYLALVEVVLVKTVMFDVVQFEWRGIDQHDGILLTSTPGYAVHHNTRSSDKNIFKRTFTRVFVRTKSLSEAL